MADTGNGAAASQRRRRELLKALGERLTCFSLPETDRLYEVRDRFVREFGSLATRLAQPEPAVPPAHETIRKPCTIGGRRYLVCGFLKAGQPFVDCQTMLDRTEVEGTKPIDEEEWVHLCQYRVGFLSELLWKYYLVTARRSPDLLSLSCFIRSGMQWGEFYDLIDRPWDVRALVVRRVVA